VASNPHDFSPFNVDWTNTGGADGQGFSERIKALEKWMRTHRGIDYNSAGPDYPHPSQKVRALYFFEGNGRLDPNGIQILYDSSGNRGIYWLPAYTDSPNSALDGMALAGYINGGTDRLLQMKSIAASGLFATVETHAGTGNAYVQFNSAISPAQATMSFKTSTAGVENAYLSLENTSGVNGVVIQPDGLTADPLTAADGQLFWRSDTDKYRVRLNGAYENLATESYVTAAATNHVPFAAKTGTYTTTNADGTITADATSASFTITLVTAVGNSGLVHTFKKITAANVVTLDFNGSQTGDSLLSYALSAQWSWVQFTSDGANWLITGAG
jgi:hypothetical protein